MSRKGLQPRTREDGALLKYLNGDYSASCHDIVLRYFTSDDEIRAVWDRLKGDILAEWIRTKPGTRPCAWWRFDAPREYSISRGLSFAMRKQLTGPPHELSAVLPILRCGLPVDHLEGRTFESETEFLRRHHLLTEAEKQ